MAFYAVHLSGDTRAEYDEVRSTCNAGDADYTGHPGYYYAESRSKIDQFRKNLIGVAGDHISASVKRISKKEFEWKKHQGRSVRRRSG